ncbi:hypothetical protein DM02DRAFT_287147 [Periconia macrospinosa]|uniref:RNase MRP protein 1 RNA binding domain-containing protein n=1 Tax=Periconia macrospinosa TaxID=97972 RepID=A0A2V1EAY8_9PLEO|nr:hypothetical protein DM02DRAFT_287147 [Periconia macrospinosa]
MTSTTLSGEALQALSDKDKQNLADIHELLRLLFTRNRNQHRRSHWFSSLHQFRRQLGLLLEELASRKKSAAAKSMLARLQYWDERCIHQWYLQFSQLLAVGPFASLGLVLVACVARVCRITGITGYYEEIASQEAKDAMTAMNHGLDSKEFGAYLKEDEPWDQGEAIPREE